MTPLITRLNALGLRTKWHKSGRQCHALDGRLTVVESGGECVVAWSAPTTMPDVPDCAFVGSTLGTLASVRSHVYRWIATRPELLWDFRCLSGEPVRISRTGKLLA